MNVNERIRMARLLNHISQQPEYAKKIGITVGNRQAKQCLTSETINDVKVKEKEL